jgi:hypothetical protein
MLELKVTPPAMSTAPFGRSVISGLKRLCIIGVVGDQVPLEAPGVCGRCGRFGVVDPAQVHGGDSEVGVSELALDDQQ